MHQDKLHYCGTRPEYCIRCQTPVPAEQQDDWWMCTLKDGCQHFTTFKGCECDCHSPKEWPDCIHGISYSSKDPCWCMGKVHCALHPAAQGKCVCLSPTPEKDIEVTNFHCSTHGYLKPVPKCPQCLLPIPKIKIAPFFFLANENMSPDAFERLAAKKINELVEAVNSLPPPKVE